MEEQVACLNVDVIVATFIQTIALAILIVIIILVVKWQVDDDIKKMEKRLDDAHKEINKKQKL